MSSPKLICIGASLTEGTVSSNFVDLLQIKFPRLEVINSGVNGDLAWNALQRLSEKVIAHQPQGVSILLGTNDVNCTLSERNRFRYLEFNKLPIERPDLAWYEENLRKILSRIKSETSAQVAMLSLPMIGEDMDHISNQRMQHYNKVIQSVAQDFGATFIPLHDHMLAYLKAHEADRAQLPPRMEYRDGLIAIGNAIALHSLGMSWNEVSAQNGLLLLTDCLHLNDTAAAMVSELVGNWIKTTFPDHLGAASPI